MLSCRQFTRSPLCLSLDDAFHDTYPLSPSAPTIPSTHVHLLYLYNILYIYTYTIREHTIKPRNPCDPERGCVYLYIYIYVQGI